ncbi:TPA: hypothetical protein N0F65_000894 [Lagenidium giganteum]|uniref:Uncharacterized protein n=1 Tax=Lagenidium giganteum TaxID=4803 RepID=A0AAV2Z1S5_9STRA|nr:TPA: hypothetical protein N0F65_000894 [Lagenidium giganteum]
MSAAKYLCGKARTEAERQGITICRSPSVAEETDVYGRCSHVLAVPPLTERSTKRRRSELSWRTVVILLQSATRQQT